MTYQAYACETITGRNLGPLDVLINSWSRELNGTDTASVSMFPGALTVANRDWIRLLTTPWRMSLLIEWTDSFSAYPVVVFYGPFKTRAKPAKQVDFTATGVRSIFGLRKVITTATPSQTQVLSYSNMTLGSIVVSLGQMATDPSKPGSGLPIVWPAIATDTDPTHVRNYKGFALSDVDRMWTELTGVLGGPDIDFTPSWVDQTRQYAQYTCRVGTTAQPYLYGPQQVVFDSSSPGSSVQTFSTIEDGTQMSTSQWALGSGDGVGVGMSLSKSAPLIAAGFPLLEQQKDYKTVSDQTTLDLHTQGDLLVNATPITQFGLTSNILQPPVIGSFLPGDRARVRVSNDIWIPDGDYAMRIVKFSGDQSMTMKLDVQADATGQ